MNIKKKKREREHLLKFQMTVLFIWIEKGTQLNKQEKQ